MNTQGNQVPLSQEKIKIAVVIPCFKVKHHILDVLSRIGKECGAIYVVDDYCPEETGKFVLAKNRDRRVTVLFHKSNQGVGGATLTGMSQAAQDGADVIVKLDGDGQMDPDLIPCLTAPILYGEADYTKGNRFYRLETINRMPAIRIFGNAVLSFFSKASSGYWNIFDPTNGFIAIHASVLSELPIEKINRRFFFESDMLFRLYTIRAVIVEVPMVPVYGDEKSNLKIGKIVFPFMMYHAKNMFKRIFYTYFLRNFSIASIYLILAVLLIVPGVLIGAVYWYSLSSKGITATSGTVMMASLPIIIGFQILLAFIAFDTTNIPSSPIHPKLSFLKAIHRAREHRVVD